MAQLTFNDFEAYADAVTGVDGTMRVVGAGKGDWLLEVLDAGELVAMLGQDGAPVVYNGINHVGRYGVHISLPGSEVAMQGVPSGDDSFMWYAPGAEVHGFSRTTSRFLAIDLDVGAVVQRARETAGLFEEHVDRTHPVVVGREQKDALVSLVLRALGVHRRNPVLFQAPRVRRVFSGQLIHALLHGMATNLPGVAGRTRGRPSLPRNEIIRRSLVHIDQSIRGDSVIGDLALATGTSQRSLNRAFDEVFGIGPQQYYLLERLHVIRKALREASPGDTVTSICTQFGVWDQGRFAGMYHRTFGLLPSVELAAALSR